MREDGRAAGLREGGTVPPENRGTVPLTKEDKNKNSPSISGGRETGVHLAPRPHTPHPDTEKTPLLCEKGEKRKGHSGTHGHSDKPPGMIRRTMSTREQSGGRATGELRPLAHTSRPSAPNMLKDSDGKAPPLSLHLLQYIPVTRPPVRRETPAGQENPAPGHGLHRVTRPPRRRGIPIGRQAHLIKADPCRGGTARASMSRRCTRGIKPREHLSFRARPSLHCPCKHPSRDKGPMTPRQDAAEVKRMSNGLDTALLHS